MTQQVIPSRTRTRLHDIDNLRVALTVVVVLQHCAITYGITQFWFYVEPATDPSGMFLDIFAAVNSVFLMDVFFLVSGYFVPNSVDRKGPGGFMKDRLVRLGIPLLLFLLVLRPLLTIGGYAVARESSGGDHPYWLYYLTSWQPGPMWFVEVLLVFSAAYALWRHFGQRSVMQAAPTGSAPGPLAIVAFVVGLALVTYVWRIVVPTGSYWPFIGLPTPDCLPRYAALFVIGLVAHRRGWLENLTVKAGWTGLVVVIVAAVALPVILTLPLAGPGSWQSLAVASWESTFAVGMILALLVLFRTRLNVQGSRARFLFDHAFTVYVFHPLVLTALGYALAGIAAPAVAKFAMMAILAVPLCWALAYLIRQLPLARKVF
jgi:fucose 4-O-acetylase-like acetyltransferase